MLRATFSKFKNHFFTSWKFKWLPPTSQSNQPSSCIEFISRKSFLIAKMMEKLARGRKSREKADKNITSGFWNYTHGTNIESNIHTHVRTFIFIHFRIQHAVQVYYKIKYVTKLALTDSDYAISVKWMCKMRTFKIHTVKWIFKLMIFMYCNTIQNMYNKAMHTHTPTPLNIMIWYDIMIFVKGVKRSPRSPFYQFRLSSYFIFDFWIFFCHGFSIEAEYCSLNEWIPLIRMLDVECR